jgi:hypothetical protein
VISILPSAVILIFLLTSISVSAFKALRKHEEKKGKAVCNVSDNSVTAEKTVDNVTPNSMREFESDNSPSPVKLRKEVLDFVTETELNVDSTESGSLSVFGGSKLAKLFTT